MSSIDRCSIVLISGLSILVLYPLIGITQVFSQNNEAIDISIVNSSFVSLTNADANQVKVNVEYTIEDESIQNQIINAVMKVFAPNGTLIRTTSIPSGFTVQSDSGVEVLKTTFHDNSKQSGSVNIAFTDLTKKTPLSNAVTEDLELEEDSTRGGLSSSNAPDIDN